MKLDTNKWPKSIPPLSPEQQAIADDYYYHWLSVVGKFTHLEKFNHGYVVNAAKPGFLRTLEVGVGLGEHLKYEVLSEEQMKNYVAVDIREPFIEEVRSRYPHVNSFYADCQEHLPFEDGYFDRIIAIHVFEHLPNLPAAIRELYRVCNKQSGTLSIVIPCEGGLAYSFARLISSRRIFRKRYNQSYDWFIQREHINKPKEIIEEITASHFTLVSSEYYPLKVPLVCCNICIGLTFSPIYIYT